MNRETRVISSREQGWLEDALAVLRSGGLVAFPTDTVYGLAALAGLPPAVEGIFRAKARPREKSVPVLVADWPGASGIALPSPAGERLARAFWPGPLTIVLRRDPQLSEDIWSTGSVGVRAPNHLLALELLRSAGPLATSSANRSGEVSLCTASEVSEALDGRIDLIVDGGAAPGGHPSTVVDCMGDSPILVRAGPVSLGEIHAVLG